MVVFEHACIPLTVSLRKERQACPNQGKQFQELLQWLRHNLTASEPTSMDVGWDFVYRNLWEERFVGRRFTNLPTHFEKVLILWNQTYWFKRISTNIQLMVVDLLKNKKGLLQLKEILHLCDAIICSLMIAYPEVLMVDETDPRAHPYSKTDFIINNVISNCLFDYAGYSKNWKKFKKTLKKQAFLREEMPVDSKFIRKMSWVSLVIKEYNKTALTNSKAKMFRVCAFTQARASGLANKKMVASTIKEFVEEVTTIKEFNPNQTLIEATQWVCERIAVNAQGPTSNFKVSMSTSACTEMRKSAEGKFGFLKQLFERSELPPLPEFNIDNPGGQIGNFSFREAIRKVDLGHTDVWKTNVSGIRENGKCRVVTAGSFYKDALLQPFSHITIEALKCDPLLRDGFQAARLGYKLLSRINHLDPENGLLLFEDDVWVMSFDWTKATDRPSFKSAHFTMGCLLRQMNLSEDVIEKLFRIWPGPKDLYINGKYVGRQVNGIPMGDPLTKSNLSLAHPICENYADRKVGKLKGIGAGNGDDGVEIKVGPKAKEWFDAFLEASSLLGYDLSEDDFFITRDWFTYCEEFMCIPIDRYHTLVNSTRCLNDNLSPYLDVPKFRLIVDTKKDRKDFSSDTMGKYTLFGKDMEYVRKGQIENLINIFDVASACQDVCLGLKYCKQPVYIPRQIYGIGKVPTLWNPENWARALMSQKSHARRLTLTLMREALQERDQVLLHLKGVMVQNIHFDSESYLEIKTIPKDDPIKKYVIVPSEKQHLFPEGTLQKLIDGGRLIPESKIQAYYLFQERIKQLSQTNKADLFEVIKGMNIPLEEDDDFDTIVALIKRFKTRFEKSPYTLKRSLQEDLYSYTLVETLAQANPLRVDFPEWEYTKRFTKRLKPEGPYERSIRVLDEWFDNNYEAILAEDQNYDLPPCDVIADDPIMILRASRSTADIVIFVTNDRKLVTLANAKVPERPIWRISVETWVNHDADENSFLRALKQRLGNINIEIIVDQGAFETFLLKTDINPTNYPGFIDTFKRTDIRRQEQIYDVYLPPRTLNETNILGIIDIPKNIRRKRFGELSQIR